MKLELMLLSSGQQQVSDRICVLFADLRDAQGGRTVVGYSSVISSPTQHQVSSRERRDMRLGTVLLNRQTGHVRWLLLHRVYF